MKIYEITLHGFDASSDSTDHLVKWATSDSDNPKAFEVLEKFCSMYGASITELDFCRFDMSANCIDFDLSTKYGYYDLAECLKNSI